MTAETETDGLIISPREILAMLYRRRYWVILTALLGLAAAIGAVALQRPSYRSNATLLIDSQQIPTSVIASPLTSIANERIAKIRQQIVSRESLAAIIREHGLYQKEQQAMAFDDVLNVMRGAIGVELVGATENDNNAGRTIAFTLSFTYQDADTAQAVTRTLTELFLREDKRFRTEQATGTAAFLGRRAEELGRQLSRLEENRREIEARYAGALPTQVGLSAQSEASLRAEVSRIDAESQGLAQQNSLLAAREREAELAPRPEGEALRRAEERLSQLEATYADNYPDVVAARAAVARQRAALARIPQQGGGVIQSEIAAGRSRIEMLASRRGELIGAISELGRRTALAPQASYELAMVEREYDNVKRQYEDLREKQLEAQVAANLQTEDKGERFSVIDEPSMPYESLGPKRLMMLIFGLIAGAGAGAVVAVAYELLNGTIHGENGLARAMGAPPMGVIPIDNPASLTIFGRKLPGWLGWRNNGGRRHAH